MLLYYNMPISDGLLFLICFDSPARGFAEVARVAAEMYRPHLATLLLNHEPRSHAQVEVLVQLSREGDEKDRDIMLRLALDKAARSWDPDLMNSALFAACSGDPCERRSDIQVCAKLIKERLYELQVLGDMVSRQLMREQFDRARMFNDLLDRKRQAAFAALHRVFRQSSYDERTKLLRFSKDLFGILGLLYVEVTRFFSFAKVSEIMVCLFIGHFFGIKSARYQRSRCHRCREILHAIYGSSLCRRNGAFSRATFLGGEGSRKELGSRPFSALFGFASCDDLDKAFGVGRGQGS